MLLTVLAPDVALRAQGAGGSALIRGPAAVANQATTFARWDALAHPALVDGLPGALITIGGRPITVMAFTVTDGAITAIHALTAPARLGQVVPSWVA
jgi:RNA polymerase sigma-70 factor (ECF subfamily)